MDSDKYKSRDKGIAAFLLTLKDITYEGCEGEDEILFFLFSPNDLASKYATQYLTKSCNPIQPKDFYEASETITNFIWDWRHKKDAIRERGGQ